MTLSIRRCLAIPLALACACGGVKGSEDAGPDSDAGPTPNARRSIAYYFDNRTCMSDPDSDGVRSAFDQTVSCRTDDDCADAAFGSCRHLEEILSPAEARALGPNIEKPPTPEPSANPSDFRVRYVPLCADGSGDHEHAIGSDDGVEPTCSPDDYIRCTDGTRPIYFVNVADQASNDWLIWAGSGGFNLFAEFTAWLGIHQDRKSFGRTGAPPSTRGGLEGIFTDQSGTAFDDFNRVWVEKCTPDRWQGIATRTETADPVSCDPPLAACTGTLEPPAHDPARELEVYYHGARILPAVLVDLADAVRLRDDAGEVVESAPALATAERVVFSCHSNGCNGMAHLIDERAALVSQLAPGATTRALFNNFFTAALEGEHAFDEVTRTIDGTRSMYDHVTTGFSLARDAIGNPYPISTSSFASGQVAMTFDLYASQLDASCIAFHPNDPAICNDSMHVLANHLSTEFFYVLAQGDMNLLEGGGSKAPYCDGNAAFPYGCPFAGVELDVVAMTRKQLSDIFFLGQVRRCEAGTEGRAPYNTMTVWAPAFAVHAGIQDTAVATREVAERPGLPPQPLHQVAADWIESPFYRSYVEDIPTLDVSAQNDALGFPVGLSP